MQRFWSNLKTAWSENPLGIVVLCGYLLFISVTLYFSYQSVTTPSEHRILKATGRLSGGDIVTFKRERADYGKSNTINHRVFLSLQGSPIAFAAPRYLNWILPYSTLKDARRIEIEYYADTYYHNMEGDDGTLFHERPNKQPYHMMVGLKIDGRTYLTPWIFRLMDNGFFQAFLFLVAIFLLCVLRYTIPEMIDNRRRRRAAN